MSNVGNRLKEIRTVKNITQQEFGNILGVSKQAIANIEGGYSNPSLELMSKLYQNFNVNLNWLIVGEEYKFNPPKIEDIKEDVLKEVDRVLIKYGIKKQ